MIWKKVLEKLRVTSRKVAYTKCLDRLSEPDIRLLYNSQEPDNDYLGKN